MLDQVFMLAGISRVIWVDDQFDPPRADETYFRELLAAACALKATPRHGRLVHLADERDVDLWTAEAVKLSRLDDDERRAVIAELRAIAEGGQLLDYSPGDVSALQAALANATCLGLEAWRQQRDTIKPTLGEDTLLLFDRQFIVNGRPESLGEDELQDIVRSGVSALVVVLTHSIGVPEVEGFRTDLAMRLRIPASAFAVMAKRTSDPDVVNLLVQSVKTVLTHRMCERLASTVGGYLKEAVDDAVKSLLDHSVVDLDRAVFQNSRAEGASEFDVMVRILSLRARVVAEEKFFAELPGHAKQVSRLRAIHDLAGPLHIGKRASSQLLEWQRDEVYDPGRRLNPVHLPLVCGDIFETVDASKMYVLLAAPCDLAVRPNGARRLTEGWFVRLRSEPPGEDSKSPERWRSLPSFRGDDAPWWLDYREACSVDLSYLDFAVFGSDGEVKLSLSQSEPDMLLPGWRVRFQEATKRLRRLIETTVPESASATAVKGQVKPKGKAPPGAFPLALNEEKLKTRRWGALDPAAKELAFAFRRIGRLRQPYARAAYDGLFRFHLRPAFEFEFAKGTGDTSEHIGASGTGCDDGSADVRVGSATTQQVVDEKVEVAGPGD